MAAPQTIDALPPKGPALNYGGEGDAPLTASLSRNRPTYDSLTNVNVNGCFESDRVIKSGYVEKRTKTKVCTAIGSALYIFIYICIYIYYTHAYIYIHTHSMPLIRTLQKWKTVYLVMRPNTLAIYKNEKETKLRHQLYLSDLTAVTFLKDPKQKRDNVFGLFSPSRNFHLQAPTKQDAQEWVDLIRREARIEEEEEEMFLANPLTRSLSPGGMMAISASGLSDALEGRDVDGVLSSSPETYGPPEPSFMLNAADRRKSSTLDSSGMSGNDLPSHSDLSDTEFQRPKSMSFIVSLPPHVSSFPLFLGSGTLPSCTVWAVYANH